MGGCALFSGSSWVPKVAWAEAYLHTKWHLSPSSRLATADIGRKLGGSAPLGEGRGAPSNTMSRLMYPAVCHNKNGPKVGEELSPLLGEGSWFPI